MMLLECNEVKQSVRDRLLFEVDQLKIFRGDRIGLVGKNGSGKSTLLSILTGETTPDEGTVSSGAKRHLLPQLKRTDTTKSGGEVTQEYINQALAVKAEILFADEPTTNLDTVRLDHLEHQLKRFQGALVLVSHDRAFLDQLCTKIWEIDVKKVKEYKGNYTDYVKQKELEKRQHEEAYEQYTKKKKQLEEAIKLKEQKAARAVKTPKDGGVQATNSAPYFAKKQKKLYKTASAFETKIEQLEEVEKPKKAPVIKMSLPNEEAFMNRKAITVGSQKVNAGGKYLFTTPSFIIKGGEKVALIGQNGAGKTTLINKIMQTAKDVRVSPSAKIGYFSQKLDILKPEKSILENVSDTAIQKEEIVRTVLARLHFKGDDVFKNVHVLSGGERVKVAFAKVFLSDLNVLILDEPTNFLDIEAVEALEQLLVEFKGTIFFVSHDRRFIEHIATQILEIKDHTLTFFNGTYKEFKDYTPKAQRDQREDELLKIETKISEVLSRLSIAPSEELDKEFNELLEQKRNIK